jgi:acylphosphatase
MIARRLVIAGRVQGVGFRESLVALARREHVAGWVRNVRDGTVEAWLQGDQAAVERVIAWCRHGPPAAHVTGVDMKTTDCEAGLTAFSRRATV